MKILLIICLIISSFLLSSCKKNDNAGSTVVSPTEPSIIFEIDASAANLSPSSIFDFNVKLTSSMPTAQGIKIDITAVEEVSGLSVSPQNPTTTSKNPNIALSVINLPRQKWVAVTVKVASVATMTNNASKTFSVVYK